MQYSLNAVVSSLGLLLSNSLNSRLGISKSLGDFEAGLRCAHENSGAKLFRMTYGTVPKSGASKAGGGSNVYSSNSGGFIGADISSTPVKKSSLFRKELKLADMSIAQHWKKGSTFITAEFLAYARIVIIVCIKPKHFSGMPAAVFVRRVVDD